jgi:membrane associated rhomboid family serine protease
MWLLELLDLVLPWEADQHGIESRTISGLPGIVFSPFLHADFAHLLANTIPFLILGSLVAWRSAGSFWLITITITVLGGLSVWLLGPANVITLGASGLIFGFLTYLITAGILTRHWLDIAVGLASLFVYGGLFWATLPFGVSEGVSWLAHLAGAVAGVVSALWFARRTTKAKE